MDGCWDIDPVCRPTFKQLVVKLESLKNDYDYEGSYYSAQSENQYN